MASDDKLTTKTKKTKLFYWKFFIGFVLANTSVAVSLIFLGKVGWLEAMLALTCFWGAMIGLDLLVTSARVDNNDEQ